MSPRNYSIKRIKIEDNIADITDGYMLEIPEYHSYDLVMGLKIQKSGDETLRLCKYEHTYGGFRKRNYIDFIKSELKAEVLEQLIEVFKKIKYLYRTNKYPFENVSTFKDSSLTCGESCAFVYSICYYKDSRHIGIAFRTMEGKFDDLVPMLRFFRIDLQMHSTYEINIESDSGWYGHRAFEISLSDLNFEDFLTALGQFFNEMLSLVSNLYDSSSVLFRI